MERRNELQCIVWVCSGKVRCQLMRVEGRIARGWI